MELDLCVYGTPHGFSSYEVPVSMGEYCERFYRTNRRGRMLMENRRNDGTTVYSFLVYDLIESDKRPNAFFGTSFVLRGQQYIPDLRSLYMLFNSEFENLVASGRLFEHVGERLKYLAGNFNLVADLLQNYLTRLLNGLYNYETESFTPDFTINNSGQIALKNIDTPVRELTNIFKKTQWLAVSPYFKADDPSIEIDLGDITHDYTQTLESLNQMAIYDHLLDYSKLERIISSAASSINLLKKYASQDFIDNNELKKIDDLSQKINTLRSNAVALRSKTGPGPTPPQPPEPEPGPGPGPDPTPPSPPEPNGPKGSKFRLDPKFCAALGVVVIIVICFFLFSGNEKKEEPVQEPPKAHKTISSPEEEAKDFAYYLAQQDYEKALEVAEGSQLQELTSHFENQAREIIQGSNRGKAYDELQIFFSKYPKTQRICNYSGLNITARELDGIYSDFMKERYSKKEKKTLSNRIAQLELNEKFKNNLTEEVKAKPEPTEENRSQQATQHPAAPQLPKITISNTQSDYKTVLDENNQDAGVSEIKLGKGKYYVLQSDQKIRINNDQFGCLSQSGEHNLKIYKRSPSQASIKIGERDYRIILE